MDAKLTAPETSLEALKRSRTTWMLRVLPGFLLSYAGTQIVLNPSGILLFFTGIDSLEAPVRSFVAFGFLCNVAAGAALAAVAALLRFRIGTLRFVFYAFATPGLLGPFLLTFAVISWKVARILRFLLL